MVDNPIIGFEVDPADIRTIGHDLQRPECILAESDGSLWSADARGGVVHIRPDGTQEIVTQSERRDFADAVDEAARFTEGTLPNGLAFARNGDILISNFGTDRLEIMKRTGETQVLHDTIDGAKIGKVNFVLRDSKDRIWLTVSTKIPNWMDAISPNICDGFIALADEQGLRIVADGFAFTNEIRLDANEEWLYVAETTARRITRLRVGDDGSLSRRETFGPSDHGAFIDGIAFDAFGNLWGTHVMTDRIFAITPQGDLQTILDDDHGSQAGKALLAAFEEDRVTPDLAVACGGSIAPWMASVTFGGPDLKNVYIGSLRGTTIPWFRSPVAGLPMVHWNEG
ncbi:SMP-30/gluconolactonase/LRE family protein [Hoeflea prorocentri]|uniref:SMP-30/gluconolactonase/LRE family protein n=1 Tax=Hoeflea prorocentri TaxID=1922333 RepID=A0A9X3ZJB9_9HYPH|nr:SMP-30/gluconolactonase/LRE family protein [Hoeflea prorocentri]MCY6382665.1 SMP-30/gluconolactonase/LRE family protein [Hoeflea prorocentri]MDA5400465.1 SMP-30/gluconolactonase/LRE family protein [Hoeflea prorocentri]